jgi:methyl-accepting chemotaxis protein
MSWSSLSLKWKILLGTAIASSLSVIMASFTFVYVETNRLEDSMGREIDTLASVAANNALGALAFEDSDSASEVLKSLKANNHITGAVIYNASGNVFAAYDRSNSDAKLPSEFPSSPPATGQVFTDTYLGVSRALVSDGDKIGDIYIRVDLVELQETESQFITIAVLVIALSSIFAILLSLIIVRSVVKPINNVVSALRDIAEGEGDLTQRIDIVGSDEIAGLATSFNNFVERVHGIVVKFHEMSDQLSTEAGKLSDTTGQTSRGTEDQRREIDQVVAAVTQMNSTVHEVSNNVASAARDAEQADQQAVNGRNIVEQTMASIENLAGDIERAAEVITQLRQESQNIGAVLEVIGGIAEQTNLLALNAAIEAARAGEQGRGFAVVADEVRTLASRTQASTQEIQEMIERLQTGSKEAVKAMDKGRQQASTSVESATSARDSLQEITSSVTEIRDMTQQIAAASEQQNIVTEEINSSVVNISQVASQTSDGAREIATSSSHLANLSEELNDLIKQFKI